MELSKTAEEPQRRRTIGRAVIHRRKIRPRSVAELRAIVLGGNEAVIPNIVAPSVDVQTPQT